MSDDCEKKVTKRSKKITSDGHQEMAQNWDEIARLYKALQLTMRKEQAVAVDALSACCVSAIDLASYVKMNKHVFLANISNWWDCLDNI